MLLIMRWSLSRAPRQGGHLIAAQYSGVQAGTDSWFCFLYLTLSLSYTTSNISYTLLDAFTPIKYTLIQLDIYTHIKQ